MFLGHVADISFELNGEVRREELYYGKEALDSATRVICLDPNDPSIFYDRDGSGSSYDQWTQFMTATAPIVLGAVGLILGLGMREWPWTKPHPADRAKPPKMKRRKLRRLQELQEQRKRRNSR
ncbi:hypothetical protein AB0C02_10960 [Micromonospora sp. NPDC048999]|uniref:hypothetical protein n=1 Tax=Micromonospora sp. NPDC048999 TaxID=3155391 RepID=UPI0033FE1E23